MLDNTERRILAIEGKVVTEQEHADLIVAGDIECIGYLLACIKASMTAKDTRLHIQAVKNLNARCQSISILLEDVDVPRKGELAQAFDDLKQYVTHDVVKKLH